MSLRLQYIEGVFEDLKSEVECFAKWLRAGYKFPVPLEIKLINRPHLIDDDGTECHLRWWQLDNQDQAVKVQVAVGNFPKNLETDGPTVAYPTVVAAIGRGLSYYFQAITITPTQSN